MHNVKLFKTCDGSVRLRFFGSLFDSEPHKPVPLEKVFTPFFENRYTFEHSYGYFLPSEEDLSRKAAESVRCSLSRTRNRILKIALSGNFKYFATFTFNSLYVDRYSYDDCAKFMMEWLHSLPPNTQYIVVPELHKDGAYHFHGLFSDIKELNYAGNFKIGDVFHCPSFTFGFHSFCPISDPVRVSRYIVKYISKELIAVAPGRKRYWYSRSTIFVPDDVNLLLTQRKCRQLIIQFKERGCFNYESSYSYIPFTEIWLSSDLYNDFSHLFQSIGS